MRLQQETYASDDNDLVTGSGFNHHQIPLRRYGGGYTATGHSLLYLLFTLYSLHAPCLESTGLASSDKSSKTRSDIEADATEPTGRTNEAARGHPADARACLWGPADLLRRRQLLALTSA